MHIHTLTLARSLTGSKGDAKRKGNPSAGGSDRRMSYSAARYGATSSALIDILQPPPSSLVALSQLLPDRRMWGLCREGCNLTNTPCTCGQYSFLNADAVVSTRASAGTRLSQGKRCVKQRPKKGPKSRIFVAEFESEAALLDAYPHAKRA